MLLHIFYFPQIDYAAIVYCCVFHMHAFFIVLEGGNYLFFFTGISYYLFGRYLVVY